MLKTSIAVFAAIVIYILCFGSLACLLLPVGNFYSLETKTEATLLPMSDSEPGQFLTYRPTLSFQYGQFNLQESDYFFVGPYECRFGRITASHSNETALSGGYTPILGIMLWDGKFYFNMAQIVFSLILLLGGNYLWKRSLEAG